jgi:hypothetical protein
MDSFFRQFEANIAPKDREYLDFVNSAAEALAALKVKLRR